MGRRAAGIAAVLALVAVVSVPSSSGAPWSGDVSAISRGLDRAVALRRLSTVDAAAYRGVLARAEHALPRLPASRYRNLASVVHEVAGFWKGYDQPRSLALFSMLDFNVRWFSRHYEAPAGALREDDDGIFYRAFPGSGFQFHPLANFGKLNWFVTSHDAADAQLLAGSLLSRSVAHDGGLEWEYYFPFDGGRPPWVSGMVQAVAAQAFARAAAPLERPELLDVARRAYSRVPALLQTVAGKPWIRLYSFDHQVVLNAQLQTIVSLQDYATLSTDAGAQVLADRLRAAATALLPRFDTGAWSLYAIGGPEAPLDYHRYVVTLLRTLTTRTQDPVFTSYAARFRADLTQAPAVRLGKAPNPIYPWPVDGFRDDAPVVFWVSKRSTVSLEADGVRRATIVVGRGWHTILWHAGRIGPGEYATNLTAVDVAGNETDIGGPAIEVRRDTTAPRVSATLAGARLFWRATDAESPWLRLRVLLDRPGARRWLTFGIEPMRGSYLLRVPRGRWSATLVAADSSRNATRVALGSVRGRGR